MSDFKLDFLNISSLVEGSLANFLASIPHELQDMLQNIVSLNGDKQKLVVGETLLLNGVPAAKIKLSPEQKSVAPLLQSYLQDNYDTLLKKSDGLKNTIIADDLEKILHGQDDFKKQIKQLLRFCRAHLLVEDCGIFAVEDGFRITGIAQEGHPNKNFTEDWQQEYSDAVGITISTKAEYQSLDTVADTHFKTREVGKPLKNFFCLPLLRSEGAIGAIYFSNKILGAWSEEEKGMAKRFADVATTIVEKHLYQNKIAALSKTSDHLGKYLSKKVVKNVKKTEKIEIGGVEKKVVCLFADIRSFTSITEGLAAGTLVQLLNYHFEQMSAIIEKYEGTLDKIVGDLIMAVWNIPHDQPEPELLAMNCAIDMQKEMKRVVTPEWQRQGVKTVGMGIGVNAGLAVAGNLGSSRFMNYTVVGDTINIAQRLESRAAVGEIWMAESMFPSVEGKIEKYSRKENFIKLKGKEDAVSAYIYRPLSY